MTILYDSDVDILNITFAAGPYAGGGAEDTEDPDVVLHYDEEGRIAEIEISNASRRIDLEEMRRRVSVEIAPTTPTPSDAEAA